MNGSTVEEASKIFRDWAEIEIGSALAALAFATLLVVTIRFGVSKLASWLPERFRFYVLPWAPIMRLVILLATIAYVTPKVINPTPENLLAVGGGMAVAIGFAFKDYVSSLLAGVVVLFERPYRTGDWVRFGGAYGEVRSLGMRAVRIVTPDDTEVVVPHGTMWTQPVHNDNSGARELLCVADFYLEPEHDGAAVSEALGDVAWTSPYLHLAREVAVVAAERPWGSHYRLKAYPIDGRDQFRFTTDLTIRGKAALARLGVRAARPVPVADGSA